jgi:hypothetical protein
MAREASEVRPAAAMACLIAPLNDSRPGQPPYGRWSSRRPTARCRAGLEAVQTLVAPPRGQIHQPS